MQLFVNAVLGYCRQVTVVSRFVLFMDHDLLCGLALTCNKSDNAERLKLSRLLVFKSCGLDSGLPSHLWQRTHLKATSAR
jgi:hypothetical protein